MSIAYVETLTIANGFNFGLGLSLAQCVTGAIITDIKFLIEVTCKDSFIERAQTPGFYLTRRDATQLASKLPDWSLSESYVCNGKLGQRIRIAPEDEDACVIVLTEREEKYLYE